LYEYFFFMLEYGKCSKRSDDLVDVAIDSSFCERKKIQNRSESENRIGKEEKEKCL